MPPDDARIAEVRARMLRGPVIRKARTGYKQLCQVPVDRETKVSVGRRKPEVPWAHLCSLKRSLLPGVARNQLAAHSMSMDEKGWYRFQAPCRAVFLPHNSDGLLQFLASVFTQIDETKTS